MMKFSQQGLSLIELAVIIAVIAVLALLTMPFFRIFSSNLQFSSAIRKLVTDLRYAEQLSVTEQVEHGIRFSLADNKYRLIKFDVNETELEVETLPQNVSFQSISGLTNNEARFNPYGAAKEAGFIVLQNNTNATTAVDIRPSGFIKIIK